MKKQIVLTNSINIALILLRLTLYIALLPIFSLICILFSSLSFVEGLIVWIVSGETAEAWDFALFTFLIPCKKLVEIVKDLVFEIKTIGFQTTTESKRPY